MTPSSVAESNARSVTLQNNGSISVAAATLAIVFLHQSINQLINQMYSHTHIININKQQVYRP